jgi:hypothetical protein
MPELRIAVANFGSGGIDAGSTDRWDTAMRWDRTISVLRAWQPHIVLGQQISAYAPGGLRAHLWTTANTLAMFPLLGPPSPGSATGNHPAVLVAASTGLVILDAGPAWQPGAGPQPAWCEALVQVPGWAHPLRAYSVDLPWRSSIEQRSQADQLATRIAERAGLGELAVAGGNWNSYGRADPAIPAALDSAPLHLRPSRMRYSPQDETLTPNYDVHDVLACVGMEDVVTALAPTPHDVASAETGVIGRADRIYLTRDLAGAAAGYVRNDVRDSEHQALMLTLEGAKARQGQ